MSLHFKVSCCPDPTLKFLFPHQWNNVSHKCRDVCGAPSVSVQNIILAVCNEESCSLKKWETAVPASSTIILHIELGAISSLEKIKNTD